MIDYDDRHTSINPADVPDHRAKGWPDFHPEDYCHDCGRPNIVWWVDGDLWGKVMEGGIVCPVCFALKANSLGVGDRTVWRLVPQCDPGPEYGGLVDRAKNADRMESERDTYKAALEALAAHHDDLLRRVLAVVIHNGGDWVIVDGGIELTEGEAARAAELAPNKPPHPPGPDSLVITSWASPAATTAPLWRRRDLER